MKRLKGALISFVVFASALVTTIRIQSATLAGPDPAAVRQAALDAGLRSLAGVPVPPVSNLSSFLNPGPDALNSARVLGKALFWDMQVGSDGQACASCHFHAGADDRAKNQLSPGLRATNPADGTPAPDTTFGNPAVGAIGLPTFGPNYKLQKQDFPFHQLAVTDERNFTLRQVLRDTNDGASSQGVFNAQFSALSGGATDQGTRLADPVFNVDGVNTRRVEPRNTPTVFNAVFNFDNFWDGRARNQFNGVSPFGVLDSQATILVSQTALTGEGEPQDTTLKQVVVVIPNSSLASQAVGPPLSDLEMSFRSRTFARVGKKMLGLRPLGLQKVHTQDSVLGPYSRGTLNGLSVFYPDLIKAAFQSKYWESTKVITFDQNGKRVISMDAPPGAETFTQMQANFSLFFGLAVQLYETTLISDQTPFDRFMAGDNSALDARQLKGLLVFINQGTPAQAANPVFTGISHGNCVSCHSGPEFTSAAFTSLTAGGGVELIQLEETPQLVGGVLQAGDATAFVDAGFVNLGVRPTAEDLGRGGTELGKPLSFTRQALAGYSFAPKLPKCGVSGFPECPAGSAANPRVQVDGAFKVPGLRNVELTGPYFHNGAQSVLEQVIEFYDRQGDFGDVNIANLDDDMVGVLLNEGDEELLVRFLIALTDPRVRNESAPFDHPEIRVPNGHPGNEKNITCVDPGAVPQACDDTIMIPAVGRDGRNAQKLRPLDTFLKLSHLYMLRDGLVLALGFNEGQGFTSLDASVAGNHAVIDGATWVPGRGGVGSALAFDGIDDVVIVADSHSLDVNQMTVEAWVNPRSLTGAQSVIVKEDAGTFPNLVYALYANFTAGPATLIRGDQLLFPVVYPFKPATNQWTHLAATYDGTALRLYMNGNLVWSLPVTTSIRFSQGRLRIGGGGGVGDFFAGVIDDVRVYDRALTQLEIQGDMNIAVP